MRRAGTWILALVLAAAPARPARADAAGELYADLKDVIEELLRSEITTGVVAAVEKRSPALRFYFADSLSRLSSPYWGNLVVSLRRDLLRLIGDYVFWSTIASGDTGLAAFFACVDGGATDAGCAELKKAIAEEHRSLLESRCGRFELDASAGPSAHEQLACDVALATRAALERKASLAMRHLGDLVGDILLHDVADRGVARAMRAQLGLWLRRPSLYPVELEQLFLAAELDPRRVEGEALKTYCADEAELEKVLRGSPGAGAWICFAAAVPGLKDRLRFAITIERGGRSATAMVRLDKVIELLDQLERNQEKTRPPDHRFYEVFGEQGIRSLCAQGVDPDDTEEPSSQPASRPAVDFLSCTEVKDKKKKPELEGARVEIAFLGKSWAARIGADGRVKPDHEGRFFRRMVELHDAHKRMQRMRELVPAELRGYLFGSSIDRSYDRAAAVRAFLRVARFTAEVKARWYLWPADEILKDEERLARVNVSGLLALAFRVSGAAEAASGPAARLAALAKDGSRLELGRVLEMAFRTDFRELVVETLQTGLGLTRRRDRPYERFFLSMAAFMLDEPGSETVEVTRESFRAAAKDLLMTLPQDGIPSTNDRLQASLWPTFGARLSFNEHYANQVGRDGMRYVVSAEWPTLLLAFEDFVGLQVSAVDPIAPLGEIAMRRIGDYDDGTLVWLDVLRPRAVIWLAVPQLSRRVIIGAGGGLRLVGLEEQPDSTDDRFHGRYVRDLSAEIGFGLTFVL
jgi:hypothetical protein